MSTDNWNLSRSRKPISQEDLLKSIEDAVTELEMAAIMAVQIAEFAEDALIRRIVESAVIKTRRARGAE